MNNETSLLQGTAAKERNITVSFLSKLQAFNHKLQTETGSGRFGTSRTGRQPVASSGIIPTIAIIIIDCSISMEIEDYPPNRLEAAINAATEYVNTLTGQNANAKVAVISFSDEAKTIVLPTAINNSRKIIKGIRSIKIDGATNIGNGFKQAAKILSDPLVPNNQSQIILLTDGFGDCPLSIPKKLKQQYGTIINVVGIGGSHCDVNESLLRKVATTGPDGTNHYRFIKDARTLKQHYRQLATGLIWRK